MGTDSVGFGRNSSGRIMILGLVGMGGVVCSWF